MHIKENFADVSVSRASEWSTAFYTLREGRPSFDTAEPRQPFLQGVGRLGRIVFAVSEEAKERKIDAFLAKQLKEVGIEDPRTTRRPRGSASQPPTRGCLYSAENRTESPRPADESLVAAEAEG